MSIFLLILKIIGIVLLSLVGLILFLVLLVLFVPIRYGIKAEYDDKLNADVRISYLLHIFTFILDFDGEKTDTKIKIFGIRILNKPESKKKKKTKVKENKKTSIKDNNEDEKPMYTLEGFDEEESIPEIDYSEYDAKEDVSEDENKGFFGKLTEYLSFIYNFITGFFDKVKAFIAKLKDIKDNLIYYIDLISKEHTKTTIKYALNVIFKILKAFKPRKLKGYFKFGFDDPAQTGQVLSYLSMIYPFIHDNIEISAQFEEQVLEGNIFIKGRIFIIALLIQGWKLYFNKDIRKLVKEFKKS